MTDFMTRKLLLSVAAIASALTLSACARPFGTGNDFELRKPVPRPGDIVAAEASLRQAMLRDGHAKAVREVASDDAILFFDTGIVPARDWLKSNANARVTPEKWSTTQVYMSCDAKLAATRGVWTGADGETKGMFTHIWRREYDTRGGSANWRWVVLFNEPSTQDAEESDSVATKIAECRDPSLPLAPAPASRSYDDVRRGQSPDKSLLWFGGTLQEGGAAISVRIYDGSFHNQIIDSVNETTGQ